MTATTDTLNGSFRLDLTLRDLGTPTRLAVSQDTSGVHVDIALAEPSQVDAWAWQMGVAAQVNDAHQLNGEGWWYQHTTAHLKRDGLHIHVGAVRIAHDREMTRPVFA